ncbi:MAG: S-(hydroxymethyl)glutathione dehydrogenase/alcohol dehydrogenase [Granulosicoccus sp.]
MENESHRHLPYRPVHPIWCRSRRAILGHEGAGIVLEVGEGVTSLKPGDHVIPLYTPECRECDYCLHPKTNLCQSIRETQGADLMPDGTSRFTTLDGNPILHYMGCLTFSNHTVLPEIALAKTRKDAPFDKVCYIGCGITTGIGAVIHTAKVEGDLVPYLVKLTKGGADYTLMPPAMLTSCAPRLNPPTRAGAKASSSVWQRQGLKSAPGPSNWSPDAAGTAFGGARGRTDVPKIVDWYMESKIEIDPMITHTMPLEDINKGFDLMHAGESIRSVVIY